MYIQSNYGERHNYEQGQAYIKANKELNKRNWIPVILTTALFYWPCAYVIFFN